MSKSRFWAIISGFIQTTLQTGGNFSVYDAESLKPSKERKLPAEAPVSRRVGADSVKINDTCIGVFGGIRIAEQ